MSNETESSEEITEEEVLSRWDKIKQWIEIVVATKKVAMLIWSLVFATGTAVVVGEATDTKPIRDLAVEMGILDPLDRDIVGNNAMYDELMNLIDDMENLEEQVAADRDHSHKAPKWPSHDHGDPTYQPHQHDEIVAHTHKYEAPAPVFVEHTHDFPVPVVPNKAEIDDAFLRHIKDDH